MGRFIKLNKEVMLKTLASIVDNSKEIFYLMFLGFLISRLSYIVTNDSLSIRGLLVDLMGLSLLSLKLYILNKIILGGNFELGDIKLGFTEYYFQLVIFLVFKYLLVYSQVLFDLASIVLLGILIIFNPLLEFIYLDKQTSNIYDKALEFSRSYIIDWHLSNLIVLICILILFSFFYKANILMEFLSNIYLIYRGFLFMEIKRRII